MPKYNQTSFKQGHAAWNKIADTCKIDGCQKKHDCHGYCSMHYRRWRRNGSPDISCREPRAAIYSQGNYLIPLGTNGKDGYTIVSLEDKWVEKYFWHKGNTGYAATRIDGKIILLQCLILKSPSGLDTDHINGDKLDNRRENLQKCSRSVNMLNYHRLRRGELPLIVQCRHEYRSGDCS